MINEVFELCVDRSILIPSMEFRSVSVQFRDERNCYRCLK